MSTVVDYYAACLPGNTKALAFVCDELKLTPEEAAQQRIGFSDRSLGTQLPQTIIKQGRQLRENLQSLGLFSANGRETLRGFVTVPCVDADGNVIGIRGFKIAQHAGGPATILIGEDDSVHSPSAVANVGCTVAGAASHTTKAVSVTVIGEGYGTRSVPTTIDEIILQDNKLDLPK